MKRKPGARELEIGAAAAAPPKPGPALPPGEAMAMLVRRGLHPERGAADVPFPYPPVETLAAQIAEWLGHYAFRLFLRGAILKPDGFLPAETTRYLTREQCLNYAKVLAGMGLAEKMSRGRYQLRWRARSFGGTLEWYVGRELERRFGFSVATGIKLHYSGLGGDLDVVAAAEGRLVYAELKSSPPRNLDSREIAAYCDRLNLLRPDLSLFVVDTALRLSDKIVPMFLEEFARRGCGCLERKPVGSGCWSLTPHIYIVNGSRDLMANIGKAIAAGLRAAGPAYPSGHAGHALEDT